MVYTVWHYPIVAIHCILEGMKMMITIMIVMVFLLEKYMAVSRYGDCDTLGHENERDR
jgi:hypothetical protein